MTFGIAAHPSRRETLAAALAVGAASVAPAGAQTPARSAPAKLAYVGCRTTRERNARGDGISVYRLTGDGASAWEQIQLVPNLLNPSYLITDASASRLYTVHGDSSEVSAFAIDPATGALSALNTVSCAGRNPVHIAFSKDGRWLVVANHITKDEHVSNVAVLPVNPDGSLGPAADVFPLKGKIGPHRVEQPFAKPHQIVFDAAHETFLVPDKGLDVVHSFRLAADGKVKPAPAKPMVAREGDGVRHAVFHPTQPWAFFLNELSSTVIAARYEAASGGLTPYQYLSCLPDSFVGFSRASEIDVSLDGRFVYASNRGHESIASFSIDPQSGRLTAVGWAPSGGKTPRFFAMGRTGATLFAANEDSDTIVAMQIDATTGLPSPGAVVAKTGSPTSIVFKS